MNVQVIVQKYNKLINLYHITELYEISEVHRPQIHDLVQKETKIIGILLKVHGKDLKQIGMQGDILYKD
jgi:hypothetical protein